MEQSKIHYVRNPSKISRHPKRQGKTSHNEEKSQPRPRTDAEVWSIFLPKHNSRPHFRQKEVSHINHSYWCFYSCKSQNQKWRPFNDVLVMYRRMNIENYSVLCLWNFLLIIWYYHIEFRCVSTNTEIWKQAFLTFEDKVLLFNLTQTWTAPSYLLL